ncbi:MAG: hypothetical protein ABFS42_13925 [Candidatus Krumholzibacteriota bacterium]
MGRNPSQNHQQDRQLERLAGQMRDIGTAPDRDLWPDIEAAIDREEQGGRSRLPSRHVAGWLRITATAAALTLMLAAGWLGMRSITGQRAVPELAGRPEAGSNGMAVIDQALDELTLALADDPENRNLSHLVLMVHKTRGNLLRRNSEKLVRE